MREPLLGLILPPAKRPPPVEIELMYPAVRFELAWLGLEQMTPEGYEGVLDRIEPAACRLAADGARAIVLMGTSLSFYKGAAFNRELMDVIGRASGLPVTTMSTAVVEGLRAVGGQRVAVATAYADEVNRRLRVFLEESGFEVLSIEGLGFERIGQAGTVSESALVEFCAGACHRDADALLVSCGGLRTLDMIGPLEDRCGVPVVSSMPHALWAGVRLLGLSGAVPGVGRLLAANLAPSVRAGIQILP